MTEVSPFSGRLEREKVVFLRPLREKPHNWLKWLLFSSRLLLEVIGIYELFMARLCRCQRHTGPEICSVYGLYFWSALAFRRVSIFFSFVRFTYSDIQRSRALLLRLYFHLSGSRFLTSTAIHPICAADLRDVDCMLLKHMLNKGILCNDSALD